MPLFDRLIVKDTPTGFVRVDSGTLRLLSHHPMTGEEAQWFGKQMEEAGRRASVTTTVRALAVQGQLALSTEIA